MRVTKVRLGNQRMRRKMLDAGKRLHSEKGDMKME